VWLYWKSAGTSAIITPEKPPIENSTMKAIAHSIGTSKLKLPRHIVVTQLKIFTPVGTAISMVENMKNTSAPSGRPTVNMWCDHTMNDRNAMHAIAYTIAL